MVEPRIDLHFRHLPNAREERNGESTFVYGGRPSCCQASASDSARIGAWAAAAATPLNKVGVLLLSK
jgi:hypothetical protein